MSMIITICCNCGEAIYGDLTDLHDCRISMERQRDLRALDEFLASEAANFRSGRIEGYDGDRGHFPEDDEEVLTAPTPRVQFREIGVGVGQ